MNTIPDNQISTQTVSATWKAPATAPAEPRTYLYFVAYCANGGVFGNCYMPLSFEIESKADVEWLRDQLRGDGVPDAVVLSFALLPGGLGD